METRRSRLRRTLWIVVPILAVAAVALPRALAWGHHHAHPKTQAELAEHLEQGLDHLLDRVDATDAQREAASEIAERRAPELFALMGEAHAMRTKLKQVMLADKLDKAQLEQTRDQITALSKRASDIGLDSAFELAEVLTPAQRKLVADRLARFER